MPSVIAGRHFLSGENGNLLGHLDGILEVVKEIIRNK